MSFKWQIPRNINRRTDRAVTLTVALALIVLLLVLLVQPAGSGQAPVYVEHVVSPGETLSDIAIRYVPGRDWRETVHEIIVVNGVTPLIRPGQVLLVPVR